MADADRKLSSVAILGIVLAQRLPPRLHTSVPAPAEP